MSNQTTKEVSFGEMADIVTSKKPEPKYQPNRRENRALKRIFNKPGSKKQIHLNRGEVIAYMKNKR